MRHFLVGDSWALLTFFTLLLYRWHWEKWLVIPHSVIKTSVTHSIVIWLEHVLHRKYLSWYLHTNVLVLGWCLSSKLKLLHMWSVLLSLPMLVFLVWGCISLQAILIYLEVTIDHTTSLFGGCSLELLSSPIIFGHKSFLGWRDIYAHNIFWVEVSMRAPNTAFWWCFNNRWLPLVALTNFSGAWRNITDLLINNSLWEIMWLVAYWLLRVFIIPWRLVTFLLFWQNITGWWGSLPVALEWLFWWQLSKAELLVQIECLVLRMLLEKHGGCISASQSCLVC